MQMFLDESGDHGLSHIDPNFPLFLLCGCLFSDDALVAFEEKMNALKRKYWNTTDVILYSREIRKCEGPFQILFDLLLKEQFYNDLNVLIADADFTVIAAAIDKEKHIKRYGKLAHDPYDVSLSFMMERFVFCLDEIDNASSAQLIFEKRGYKEDTQITSHFNAIRDAGTYFVDGERMRSRVTGCHFHAKMENIVGLQCADLCAYPLARSIVLKGEPSKAADIVSEKVYTKNGKQYGFKIFP
tara:strand:+ start:1457 stop:2182 length:726 start_codon:yes stop_codon:yes gene_type:complete